MTLLPQNFTLMPTAPPPQVEASRLNMDTSAIIGIVGVVATASALLGLFLSWHQLRLTAFMSTSSSGSLPLVSCVWACPQMTVGRAC